MRELGELEDRLLQWHVANIEYSTAADVNDLSLRHWDQDDKTAFEGSHCVIREGFGAVVDWLANKVGRDRIKLGVVVGRIERGFDRVGARRHGRDGARRHHFRVRRRALPALAASAAAAAAAATEKKAAAAAAAAPTPQTILRILGSDATAPDASGRQRRRIAANLKAGSS